MAFSFSVKGDRDEKLFQEFRWWLHRQNEGRPWTDRYTLTEAVRDALAGLMWAENDGFPPEGWEPPSTEGRFRDGRFQPVTGEDGLDRALLVRMSDTLHGELLRFAEGCGRSAAAVTRRAVKTYLAGNCADNEENK